MAHLRHKKKGEVIFFVVDQNDTGNLEQDIKTAGIKWEQDSVLFIKKGSQEGYLIGTNTTEFPGWEKFHLVGNPVFGSSGEFMTKVKGSPFIFESAIIAVHESERYSRMGEWARQAFINSNWEEVDEGEPIIDHKRDFKNRFA